MFIPKPDTKKDRARKKRQRAQRRSDFHFAVLTLDPQCRNPWCKPSYRPKAIDACHIEPKRPNAPHLDTAENGIGLCRRCHDMFDGRAEVMIGKMEYSTLEFRIKVLEFWPAPIFRWAEALEYLKSRQKT